MGQTNMEINSAFLTDGYKLDHRRQYPEGLENVYATWIPRSNQHMQKANKIVVFGIQYTLKYITKHFQYNFFNRPLEEIIGSYHRMLNDFIGPNTIGTEHIKELHQLGYLPIEVHALEEGSLTEPNVPHCIIVNTDSRFGWITNYLETMFSALAWLPSTSATIASIFYENLIQHAKETGWSEEQLESIGFLCHDFSMRGMQGYDSCVSSGMGHLTVFTGSETIPAIESIREYYPVEDGYLVAGTVPATEHSVATSYLDNTITEVEEYFDESSNSWKILNYK